MIGVGRARRVYGVAFRVGPLRTPSALVTLSCREREGRLRRETVRARFLIGYMIFRERAETCSSLWLIYSIYLSSLLSHVTPCVTSVAMSYAGTLTQLRTCSDMQPLHNKLHKHKSGWPAPAAPAAAVRCPQVVVMFMGAPALGGVASTRLWPCAAAAEATALSPAAVAFGFEADGAGGGAGGGGGTAKTRPLGVWTRKLAGWLAKTAARPPPAVLTRHAVRAARPRLARVWRTYSGAHPRGRLPCASGARGTAGRHEYPARTARLRHGAHVNTRRHPCPYPDRRGPCPCPCHLARRAPRPSPGGASA